MRAAQKAARRDAATPDASASAQQQILIQLQRMSRKSVTIKCRAAAYMTD